MDKSALGMTTADTLAAPARLAFGATLRAAFGIVFGRLGLFLRAAAMPFLLSLVLTGFEVMVPVIANAVDVVSDSEVTAGVLLIVIGALSLFPFAIFGVVLTRLCLDGPAAGILPRPFPGKRVWRFFGYSLLMTFCFILAIALMVVPVAILAEGEFGAPVIDGVWIVLAFVVFLMLVLYLLLRLSLVFPAIAMDDSLRLRGSWRLTRKGSLKLSAACGVLLLMQLLAIFIGSTLFGQPGEGTTVSVVVPGDEESELLAVFMAGAPNALWNSVVGLLFFAMFTGALASAYAQLTGWGAPRQEILDRFE